jgi:hypothetical protein
MRGNREWDLIPEDRVEWIMLGCAVDCAGSRVDIPMKAYDTLNRLSNLSSSLTLVF